MNLKNAHVGDAYLANGDVGRVLRIDKAERKVFARFGDAKVVQEYPADHPDLTHAWCVTAHKSQGDEADRVVFYMDGPILASREMLNTVVTRAKTGASLIVSRPALAACLSKSVRDERCTRLAKRLCAALVADAKTVPDPATNDSDDEDALRPSGTVTQRNSNGTETLTTFTIMTEHEESLLMDRSDGKPATATRFEPGAESVAVPKRLKTSPYFA